MSEIEPGGPNRPLLRRLLRYREWLIAGREFTARQAVDELEICERTVYRDIAYLRTLGWDLEFCRSRRRWMLVGAEAPLPLVALREAEVTALLVAEEALRGTGLFAAALHSALEKLMPLLDTPLRPEAARGALPRFIGPPPRRVPDRQMEQVQLACQQCRRLEFADGSLPGDRVAFRRVEPYRLVIYAGDAYLVAFDLEDGCFRTFALGERMQELRDTGESFLPDTSFDLERFLAEGLGPYRGGAVEEVVLCFRATTARCMRERIWHAGAIREELPGGGLLIRMRVPVNAGVLRFVLQYGADVEVLAPDALRRQVRETFRQALTAYGSEAGEG